MHVRTPTPNPPSTATKILQSVGANLAGNEKDKLRPADERRREDVEALVERDARDGNFIIRLISTTVSVNIKMYLVKSLDWPFNSKHNKKKNVCLEAENGEFEGEVRSLRGFPGGLGIRNKFQS